MNPIVLSDVATWGDKRVAIDIAKVLDIATELTPFRRSKEQELFGATSFHGSPFVTGASFSNRIMTGPIPEIPLVLIWRTMIGPLFGSIGLRIARERKIPIVLHHENILELCESGWLDRLKGLDVWVENSNFIGHPLVKSCLITSYFESIRMAQQVLPDLKLVIDLEHYLMAYYPPEGAETFEQFCYQAAKLAPIAEFHICDTIRSKPSKGHLIPGRGVMPLRKQLGFIARRFPEARVVLEHLPTIGKFKFLFSGGQSRYDSVFAEAKEAYDFVREALSSGLSD